MMTMWEWENSREADRKVRSLDCRKSPKNPKPDSEDITSEKIRTFGRNKPDRVGDCRLNPKFSTPF